MAPNLVDPFHRKLHQRLSVEIDNRMVQLASGAAAMLVDSRSTVAENYAAQVAYLQAMRDVLVVCQDLEHEQYGTTSPDEQEQG